MVWSPSRSSPPWCRLWLLVWLLPRLLLRLPLRLQTRTGPMPSWSRLRLLLLQTPARLLPLPLRRPPWPDRRSKSWSSLRTSMTRRGHPIRQCATRCQFRRVRRRNLWLFPRCLGHLWTWWTLPHTRLFLWLRLWTLRRWTVLPRPLLLKTAEFRVLYILVLGLWRSFSFCALFGALSRFALVALLSSRWFWFWAVFLCLLLGCCS